ncbi:hypothetical protein ACQ5SP_05705 [Rhodovulum sp. YNF3179]|uniref:hypothetical protein n=1 Tax=Rhodovulum sp. YNF3179 TaxID=3425127 RepID=UPI003D334308
MEKKLLIAETEENGALAWLWMARPNAVPRAVSPHEVGHLPLDEWEIHGASRDAVKLWVTRHAEN